MMRGRKYLALSVRTPDGKISTRSEPLPTFYSQRLRQIPFIRGFLVLAEALVLGTKSLMYSANISQGEDKPLSSSALWLSLSVGILFAVGLFFVAPLVLVHYLDQFLTSSLASNLIEGLVRLLIFFLYLWFINLIPEIRRVFAYHGAEHMTVNAYEAGTPLEVEKVRKYRTAHERCGTTFLILVMIIAILVFSLLGRPPMWLRILSRVAFIPLIAALAYEAIRLGASYHRNPLVKIMLIPGLAFQSLTTRIPDDSQLEVAISALQEVLKEDEKVDSSQQIV